MLSYEALLPRLFLFLLHPLVSFIPTTKLAVINLAGGIPEGYLALIYDPAVLCRSQLPSLPVNSCPAGFPSSEEAEEMVIRGRGGSPAGRRPAISTESSET